ncbi:MAG: DUF3078 domain-containing protein [Bacteroidia bacterium]|nr:DUF3078 domain-containing protein [Bacteroidia bacterium]MDW8333366.1 DUF3078 domain-containing protein [Bacteroidia bacterium]
MLAVCAQNEREQLIEKLDRSNAGKNIPKSIFNPDSGVTWKYGMVSGATFNQSAAENWSAGGQNALSLNATAGLFLDFTRNKHSWRSLADGSYGLARIQSRPLRKSQDYLEINTRYGYEFRPSWSLTFFAEGITQFAPGYNYAADPEGRTPISRFMAPGFLSQGAGVTYDWIQGGLKMRFAPLTARQIVVLREDIDETAYGVDSGKTVKSEFGASARVNFFKQIAEKKYFGASFESRLFVFFNYLQDFGTPYVNWRTKLDFKFFKVLTINVLFHLIFDPVLRFPDQIDSATGQTLTTKLAVQWMQTLGVGLGYTFVRKK